MTRRESGHGTGTATGRRLTSVAPVSALIRRIDGPVVVMSLLLAAGSVVVSFMVGAGARLARFLDDAQLRAPDTLPFASPGTIRDLLSQLGPDGRELYRDALVRDWAWLAVAAFLAAALLHLGRVAGLGRWQGAALALPALFMAGEVSENLLLLRLLGQGPDVHALLLAASSVATTLKLTALAAASLTIAGSYAVLAGRRLRRPRRRC